MVDMLAVARAALRVVARAERGADRAAADAAAQAGNAPHRSSSPSSLALSLLSVLQVC